MKKWWQFWKTEKDWEYQPPTPEAREVPDEWDTVNCTAVYCQADPRITYSTCTPYVGSVIFSGGSTGVYGRPIPQEYRRRRRSTSSDDGFATGALMGYALGGGFSDSSDSGSSFEGGGGDFGGGGASGSWE